MTVLSIGSRPASLNTRVANAAVLASLPMAMVGLRVWNPGSGSSMAGPTLCPFRICTGHACPGCGMTRALGSLVNGDVAESVRMHPLAGLVALQIGLFWMLVLANRAGHPAVARLRHWWSRSVIATLGLLVAVWAFRWELGLLDAVV